MKKIFTVMILAVLSLVASAEEKNPVAGGVYLLTHRSIQICEILSFGDTTFLRIVQISSNKGSLSGVRMEGRASENPYRIENLASDGPVITFSLALDGIEYDAILLQRPESNAKIFLSIGDTVVADLMSIPELEICSP